MASIASRIAKLEDIAGGSRGRVIVVRSTGATNDELDACLASSGVSYDRRSDIVVHISCLSAPEEWASVQMLNVTERGR